MCDAASARRHHHDDLAAFEARLVLDFGDAGPDIAWLGEETGWESAWRAFTRPGTYDVGVHFLEPFDPAALADRKQVCALARARMSAALSQTLGYPVS